MKNFRKRKISKCFAVLLAWMIIISEHSSAWANSVSVLGENTDLFTTMETVESISDNETETDLSSNNPLNGDNEEIPLPDEIIEDAEEGTKGLKDLDSIEGKIEDLIDNGDLNTDKIHDQDEIRKSIYMLGSVCIENVGARGYDIINGANCVDFEGEVFLGLGDGIYKTSGDSKEKVSDDIGENFNIFENYLVYTTKIDNKQIIKGLDINSFEEVFEYTIENHDIKNLYVINGESFYFLAEGDIYALGMLDLNLKELTNRGDIFNFIPTTYGVFYATGSLFDYDIYYGRKKIVDSASDWYINENGLVYRTQDAVTKQISFEDVRLVIDSQFDKKEEETQDVSELIYAYTMDGDAQLMGISEEDFIGVLENADRLIASDYENYEQLAVLKGEPGHGIRALVNSRQMAIVAEARRVYDTITVAKGDIIQWNKKSKVYRPAERKMFKEGDIFHGILYGQPVQDNNMITLYDSQGEPRYKRNIDIRKKINENGVVEDWPKDGKQVVVNPGGYVFYEIPFDDNDKTNANIVYHNESYLEAVNDKSSILYWGPEYMRRGSEYFSPRYSLDCSAFVSHCFGIERTTTAGIPNSSKLSHISWNGGGLQVGDALNDAGSHVVLVTDIEYDSEGRICYIEVIEQTPPNTARDTFKTVAELRNYFKNYEIYRLNEVNPNEVDYLRLSVTQATIRTNESIKISAFFAPGGNITWSSSDETVATVDQNGVVQATKKSGKAIITATLTRETAATKTAKCTIVVEAPPITLNKSFYTLYLVDGYNTVNLIASSPDQSPIKWSTTDSDGTIATVDSTGRVTAKGVGECEIVAEANGQTAKCKISVEKAKIEFKDKSIDLFVGEQTSMSVKATPAFGVILSSTDEKIATVKNGIVTAKSPGTCKIEATYKNIKSSCIIKVNEHIISLDCNKKGLYPGQQFTLKAQTEPEKDVSWSSSNENVATVANGVVTAKGPGTCDIIASTERVTAKCEITVIKPSIEISTSSMAVYKGFPGKLSARVSPSSENLVWQSADNTIATVDQSGNITGITAGKATTIFVKIKGMEEIYASCRVEVRNPSVSISKTQVTLYEGQDSDLTAYAIPSASITWKSSSEAVASYSNGYVHGNRAGSCTISASAHNTNAICYVTVMSPTLELGLSSISIYANDNPYKLSVRVSPAGTPVNFTSDNRSIATVDSNGNVKGLKAGTTSIRITAGSASRTVSVTVKEKPKPSLSISPTSFTLPVGSSQIMTVKVTPSATVTWKVDKQGIVKIVGNKVTALKVGSCTITATANGISVYARVTVRAK